MRNGRTGHTTTIKGCCKGLNKSELTEFID